MGISLSSIKKGASSIGGAVGGFLSGASDSNLVFPSNPLLSQYNLNENNLFTVDVTAFDNPIFGVTKGRIDQKGSAQELFNAQLLYSDSTFSISHSHNYGETDVSPILKVLGGAQLISEKAGTFKKIYGGIASALTGGKDDVSGINVSGINVDAINTDFNKFNTNDISHTYKGSGRQSFDVSFFAVAHKDPLNEVVLPSLLFTYLSYPRKNEAIPDFIKQLSNTLPNNNKKPDGKTGLDKDLAASIEKLKAKVASDEARKASSSLFRARSATTPPSWRVKTSNGLLNFTNAHISNITTTYYGPWLQPPTEQQNSLLRNIITGAGAIAGGGLPLAEVFPGASNIINGVSSLISGEQEVSRQSLRGLPSYVEIKVTFTNNFEQMYAEEWMSAYTSSGDGKIKATASGGIAGLAGGALPKI